MGVCGGGSRTHPIGEGKSLMDGACSEQSTESQGWGNDLFLEILDSRMIVISMGDWEKPRGGGSHSRCRPSRERKTEIVNIKVFSKVQRGVGKLLPHLRNTRPNDRERERRAPSSARCQSISFRRMRAWRRISRTRALILSCF